MKRSISPSGLFGVTRFASTFHVRSPQQRNLNFPNLSRKLRLWALSLSSFGWGLLTFANGFAGPTLGMTSPLAVTICTERGVLPALSGSASPAESFFDL